ncbi:acyl-CoA dehydrogenase [Natrarchaeobius halalkaliphilus]|uniref:Acyl-CoA dehydrogenase n=1 Tax=Natrarchaeobius halalkaliphilus TaxID=1679091 RepID=A0A3N6P0B8_9EURY|nr:acyl-CoA dehydrogenase family protein [Natrarchaeobius halalkaliphilus]RQG87878.1 acyl-CoA dehydrogenase [Natrarchaeobius halalkaliphilus]
MYSLTDEQRLIFSECRRIATEEFAPRAFTWDDEPPTENVELLADLELVGLNYPIELGGGGLSEFEVCLQIEAIGRICPDTAQSVYRRSMIAPRVIEMFGSESLKEEYITDVTAGERSISVAISEPQAGSDVQNIGTQLVEDGDGYLLTGEKTWITQGESADSLVVWTRLPDSNMGVVVVDTDQAGVARETDYTNMAGDTQTHFTFSEVSVPESHVVVSGKSGFKRMLRALNWERCASAMGCIAIALCAFDTAVEYAKTREQFGQSISEFQGLRWKFADMAMQIQLGRTMVYNTVITAVENECPPNRLQSSIAALYATEVCNNVVDEALQIHGANGYQQGHPLEYLYRLVRGKRIAAGTDEMLRNTIADAVLDEGLADLPDLMN